MSNKEMPCGVNVAKAIQREDLSAYIERSIGACFDQQDRVSCTRKIGGNGSASGARAGNNIVIGV